MSYCMMGFKNLIKEGRKQQTNWINSFYLYCWGYKINVSVQAGVFGGMIEWINRDRGDKILLINETS